MITESILLILLAVSVLVQYRSTGTTDKTLSHLVAEHNYQSGRHIYTGNERPAVIFTLVM